MKWRLTSFGAFLTHDSSCEGTMKLIRILEKPRLTPSSQVVGRSLLNGQAIMVDVWVKQQQTG